LKSYSGLRIKLGASLHRQLGPWEGHTLLYMVIVDGGWWWWALEGVWEGWQGPCEVGDAWYGLCEAGWEVGGRGKKDGLPKVLMAGRI
jgi:hypothetical protein